MSYDFRIELDDDSEEIEIWDLENGRICIGTYDKFDRCSVHLSLEQAEQVLAALYKAVELAKAAQVADRSGGLSG